jgi:hypothetical protein
MLAERLPGNVTGALIEVPSNPGVAWQRDAVRDSMPSWNAMRFGVRFRQGTQCGSGFGAVQNAMPFKDEMPFEP